jgi:hypothetical protein
VTASKPLLEVDKRHFPFVLLFLLGFSGALLALWNDANGITALATAVIAGFTATLWINSSNQLVHTREIERAYLTGGGDVETGGTVFRVEVANYGKTSAYLSAFEVEFALSDDEVKKPRTKAYQWRDFDDRIPPGGQKDRTVIERIPFDPPGAKVIYGTFRYTDIWKDEHMFRFVLRVAENGQTRPDITGVHDDFKFWS